MSSTKCFPYMIIHYMLYKTDPSVHAHKVWFCPTVGSQIANCYDVFLSYFSLWSLDLLWNTTEMNKTSQLSRVINKITAGLGAVLYNWFHIFVSYNFDQKV